MTPERIEQERAKFEKNIHESGITSYKQRLKSGEYAYEHIEFAWEMWQARAAQSEWISVEDKYPENEQEVNILLNTGEVRIALHELGTPGGSCFTKGHYFTGDIYHIDGAEYNCSIYGDDVTHWQPLPEPPDTRGK